MARKAKANSLPYNYVDRKVSTADILKALDTKYNSDVQYRGEWVGFAEFRPGTGFGADSNRYVDFWAINCFGGQGYQKISYEIKQSRSDFMTEIKNAAKRKMALLISNRFYFAAPLGLIKPEELPPEAGLVEYYWGHNQSSIDATNESNIKIQKYIDLSEEEKYQVTWGHELHSYRYNRLIKVPEYTETIESRLLVNAPEREHMVPGWKFIAAVARRSKQEAISEKDAEIEKLKLSLRTLELEKVARENDLGPCPAPNIDLKLHLQKYDTDELLADR